MTLSHLLHASPAIQVHAFAATGAFTLGVVQLAAPKGTLPHRAIGWVWVLLMLMVSVSGLFIHELRVWGRWSPIHFLVIFTLLMLPSAVWRRISTTLHSIAARCGVFSSERLSLPGCLQR